MTEKIKEINKASTGDKFILKICAHKNITQHTVIKQVKDPTSVLSKYIFMPFFPNDRPMIPARPSPIDRQHIVRPKKIKY